MMAAAVRRGAAAVARVAATLLVCMLTLVLLLVAIAFIAYRLPGFGERRLFEGVVEARKFDMGRRSLFEGVFGRGMVPLDEHTELYLPREGNPWIGLNTPSYRVTISARPLLFGGFSDAQLIKVARVDGRPMPARPD